MKKVLWLMLMIVSLSFSQKSLKGFTLGKTLTKSQISNSSYQKDGVYSYKSSLATIPGYIYVYTLSDGKVYMIRFTSYNIVGDIKFNRMKTALETKFNTQFEFTRVNDSGDKLKYETELKEYNGIIMFVNNGIVDLYLSNGILYNKHDEELQQKALNDL